MKKKEMNIMALAAAASMVLAGCQNTEQTTENQTAESQITESQTAESTAEEAAQQPEEEKDSVVVVMTANSEPEAGFDPAYGWGAGEHVHEPLIQSTLTVTTADLSIGYDLATNMVCSEDGLKWTVDIRSDAVFTDGEKLDAEDVAFTYNTLRDTSSVNDFTMLKEAAAIDEDTVSFI